MAKKAANVRALLDTSMPALEGTQRALRDQLLMQTISRSSLHSYK